MADNNLGKNCQTGVITNYVLWGSLKNSGIFEQAWKQKFNLFGATIQMFERSYSETEKPEKSPHTL